MENFADDKAKLYDIERSIDEILGITTGLNFDTFSKETDVRDDIAYQLREVGVAAQSLSPEFKETYGNVDWEVLTNLQYATWDQEMEIDPHSLWYIIQNDLPLFRDQIIDVTTMLEDKKDNFFF